MMVREVAYWMHVRYNSFLHSAMHSFSWRLFHTQEEVSMNYLRSNPLFWTPSLRPPTSNYPFFEKSFAQTFINLRGKLLVGNSFWLT